MRRTWARSHDWAPVWTARALWLVGVTSIVSALSPPMADRLRLLTSVLPDTAPTAARAAVVAVGVAAILLARGLRHRKRQAWTVAVALTIGITLLHLLKGLDVGEALLTFGVALLLVATRDAFTGLPDPRSWGRTALTFAGSASLAVIVGTALLMVDQEGPAPRLTLRAATGHAASGLVNLPGATHPALGSSGRAAVLALLGALVLVATLVAMLRPAGGPHPVTEDEEIRLRGLLDHEGESDSLGYFALRRDKSVVFSASGKAAISYRVVGGVSLASGDPLGDPEAWPGAIAAWQAEARRFAWVPAALGASNRGAQAFHRAGLDALELGDEAVVRVEEFGLDGRSMRGVRQAANRMCRLGYAVEVARVTDVDDVVLTEVSSAVDRWRDGTTERGFSMALGRLGDPVDTGCVLALARNADGELAAVLHLVPWGLDGLSLDLMRRSPDCDNGVVDLMVVRLVGAAACLGISRVSLNFAVFRSVFEQGSRLGAGPVLRLWHAVLLRASRFWQLESLYRANAKFRPEWHPRYLCFSSARDLAMVLVAAMQAEAFLPRPRMRWGRRPAAAALPRADREAPGDVVASHPVGGGRVSRRDRRAGGVIR